MKQDYGTVVRRQLPNGLEILVYPYHVIPWVATQLWYKVGSKHERDGARGAAHILEHMLFKGTKLLSETDVAAITRKLSGYCNAFTSYDYTAYVFDFPRTNWTVGLALLADCMRNGTLNKDLLHTELAAVIQELRLYKDDYESTLEEALIADMFAGHPYHHPIIGYKHDIWSIDRETLLAFYHTWYVPNNAVLVVVGDVHPDEVFERAERAFGTISAGILPVYEPAPLPHDIVTKSVRLYRDIQQPSATAVFSIPGLATGADMLRDCFSWLIANGRGSRLYKNLVHEKELATHVEAHAADMVEHDILFVRFDPERVHNIETIHSIIVDTCADLATQGPTEQEVERALHMVRVERMGYLHDMQELAAAIGQSFIATGNEQHALQEPAYDFEQWQQELQKYAAQYCREFTTSHGAIVPLEPGDGDYWHTLQDAEDASDRAFLATHVRESALEPLRYANTVPVHELPDVTVPMYTQHVLAHGCTALVCTTTTTKTIVISLNFATCCYDDPHDMQGITLLTTRMLAEGTKHRTALAWADEFERRGMSLDLSGGSITLSVLSEDLERGLTLLTELIREPLFDRTALKRVRAQLQSELQEFLDDPFAAIDHYAREYVYKDHPYGRLPFGTYETLQRIDQSHLKAWHERAMSPHGAYVAVVGDVRGYDVAALLEKTIGTLRGPVIPERVFPALEPIQATTVTRHINRDQTVICYAGLSVARTDPRYECLALVDEIVCGGELDSMHSVLFALREETGLFYTVRGSMVVGAGKQPGMVRIKTLVSPDRADEARHALERVFKTAHEHITPESLAEARRAYVSAHMQQMLSNYHLAQTFLTQELLGLPSDHEAQLAMRLKQISPDDVHAAMHDVLNRDRLACITLGR